MRTRSIVAAAILLTAGLILLSAANVFGCSSAEDDNVCGFERTFKAHTPNLVGYWEQVTAPLTPFDPLGGYWRALRPREPANLVKRKPDSVPKLARITTNARLTKPQPPPAPAPPVAGSPDPNLAPEAKGDWVYIQPYSTIWYKVNDGGRRVNVWLNSNGQSGVTLEIYGPDQQNVWESKPVGKGTGGKGFDLFWTGRSRHKGDWRVRVTNHNDFPVNYSVGSTRVADKAGDLCRDCHGIIEDEWDRCDHDGNFCEDLKDDYRN